jgi:hypothetical protein
MLIYHPAYDLNHGMFRLLRLLEVNPEHKLRWDAYRILDFYYLFPDLLVNARLPRNMTSRKRFYATLGTKYSRVPSPKMFIQQMGGIHEAIGRSLAGKGFIEPADFDQKKLVRTDTPIPLALKDAIGAATGDEELVSMLGVEMAALPLMGPNGLKERTGLLEYRYDAV